MRQSRKRLKARALRAATNWLRPTHTLNKRECNERMVGAWLRGYEAARRDAAKAMRAMVGVDGTMHAGFSIVSTDDGQGEVLTIPALGSRPKHCVFRTDMCIHGYKLVDLADGTSVCDAGCTA